LRQDGERVFVYKETPPLALVFSFCVLESKDFPQPAPQATSSRTYPQVKMYFHLSLAATAALASLVAAAPSPINRHQKAPVGQTNCNGNTYTYKEMAGYGFVASDARDKFGDSIGGMGSSAALDLSQWRKTNKGNYEGVLYTLPDRGW
jgi:hypothetical protein